MNQFNVILNGLHDDSRAYSNAIPNSSVKVLADVDIFTGYDSLKDLINSEFRDLLFRAREWHAEFEEFIGGISVELDSLLESYTQCYRQLPTEFAEEARNDLDLINRCYSD